MLLNPNKVDLSKLRYKARQALWLLIQMFEVDGQDFILTHTFDGQHKVGSLHFKNRAFDALPPDRRRAELLQEARLRMGPDWDIIDEGDHWHIEYDPK